MKKFITRVKYIFYIGSAFSAINKLIKEMENVNGNTTRSNANFININKRINGFAKAVKELQENSVKKVEKGVKGKITKPKNTQKKGVETGTNGK